jgi:hypothetical protein
MWKEQAQGHSKSATTGRVVAVASLRSGVGLTRRRRRGTDGACFSV